MAKVTPPPDESTKPTPTSTPTREKPAFRLPQPVNLEELEQSVREEIAAAVEQVEAAPLSSGRVGQLGAAYFRAGLLVDAEVCFQRALELAPAAMRWPYYIGLVHEKSGDLAKAQVAYEKSIEINAGYAAVHVRLADLVISQDRERAATLYRKAIELNPADAIAHHGLGRCHELAGQASDAAKEYKETIKLAPTFGPARRALAALDRQLGNEKFASEHEAAVTSDEIPLAVRDTLAHELLASQPEMERLLKEAEALLAEERFDEAIALQQKAVALDFTGLTARNKLALTYLESGRFAKAIEHLQGILEVQPNALPAMANLGSALTSLGKFKEAEPFLVEVLKQDTSHTVALRSLGQNYVAQRKLKEAERLLKRAVKLSKEDPLAYAWLGHAYLLQQNYEDARASLRRALLIAPDLHWPRYWLGLVYRREGNIAAAREAWQRTLKSNPKFVKAYEGLAGIARSESDFKATREILERGLGQVEGSALLANELGWLLATCRDATLRDGSKAVEWSKKACERTKFGLPRYLDTLAAAYAEAGNFEKAVSTQQKAVQLATQAGRAVLIPGYRARLSLYEKKQPYHEE